jgi:hypothetical protein
MSAHWTDELVAMDACEEAVEWARTQPSMAQAWRVCPRGDWMLWLAERRGVDPKRLAWVACQVARTALKYVPDGEDRPRLCIETTEAYLRGEVTRADVRAARDAAWAAEAAAWDAAVAARDAAWAAEAAAEAAEAAWAAAGAARAAAEAAEAAWAAAGDAGAAAGDAAEAAAHRGHARIVRREWPAYASLTSEGAA